MSDFSVRVMDQQIPAQLADVLCAIDNPQNMQNFLCDVMTKKEIIEVSARFEAAKMLTDGKTYTSVIKRTKLSSRTVARISDWLQNGTGGYVDAINTFNHLHTRPGSSV